jgi:hypothetical protein
MYRDKYADQGSPWNMEVRIISAKEGDESRDYLGFIQAPLDEIQLLHLWCEQVMDGAYPIKSDGMATLLMDLHRPNSPYARETLIGNVRPGSSNWRPKPRYIPFPNKH